MKLKHLFIAALLVFASSCGNSNSSSNEFEQSSSWTVNYYYNYEGNTSVYKSVATANETLTSKPADPTREGYIFDSW